MKKKWKIIPIVWVGLYALFILTCDNFYGAFTTQALDEINEIKDISKEFRYFSIGHDHDDPLFSEHDTLNTGVLLGNYRYKNSEYLRYQFKGLFKTDDRNLEILVSSNYRESIIVKEINKIGSGKKGFLINTHLCDATIEKLKYKEHTIYTGSNIGSSSLVYFYKSGKSDKMWPHYMDVEYDIKWIERNKKNYISKVLWLPAAVLVDIVLLPYQPIAYGLYSI